MTVAEFNVKVAGILPGLKTKICLILAGVASFMISDPSLQGYVTTVLPAHAQPFVPIAFLGAAWYAHNLTPLHA